MSGDRNGLRSVLQDTFIAASCMGEPQKISAHLIQTQHCMIWNVMMTIQLLRTSGLSDMSVSPAESEMSKGVLKKLLSGNEVVD